MYNAFFPTPNSGSVLALCLVFWFLFGILGINLWAGRFWYCNDLSVSGRTACVGNYTNHVGLVKPREWVNRPVNFDNILHALLALFQVASLDGWSEIAEYAVMAKEIDQQPHSGKYGDKGNEGFFVYFIVFIFISALFFMKLFIGVVYTNFMTAKEKQDGTSSLSDSQRYWKQTEDRLMTIDARAVFPVPVDSTMPYWKDLLAELFDFSVFW